MDILIGNDGYLDTAQNLVIAKLALLENIGTAIHPEYRLIDTNYSNISSIPLDLSNNHAQKTLRPALGDLDGDGDVDLLLGDVAGKIHYFKDTSSSTNNAAFELEKPAMQGMNVFGNASPYLFDVDTDGLLDLIIGSGIGTLEYHKNLGDSSEPIFNLEVQSITWQRDSILRYAIEGNPDLSHIQVGTTLDINNARNGDNNVFQIVDFVDNTQNLIDLKHPFTNSNIDDEINSPAVIDYSVKNWGGVSISQFNFNQNAVPFLYYDSNSTMQLLVGSKNGVIYRYDSILNSASGNFHLADSNLISQKLGENLFAHGADINGDGMIDLAIGNQAGGFSIFFGSLSTSINEYTYSEPTDRDLLIFPNPTNKFFNIIIPKGLESSFTFTLRDIRGRVIYQEESFGNQYLYRNGDLSPGIYLISISDEKSNYSGKLIKQP
jgi:hypothetical protein